MNQIIENARLVWKLVNDPRVPTWIKVGIPAIVLIYFISPVDFIPDFIPGLGQLGDIGVILLGMNLIMRFSPQSVVEEHRRGLGLGGQNSGGTTSGTGTGGSGNGYWKSPQDAGTNQATTPMPPYSSNPIDGEFKIIPPDQK